jgi:hypothetical protein
MLCRPFQKRAVIPLLHSCAALIFAFNAIQGAEDPPPNDATVRKDYVDKVIKRIDPGAPTYSLEFLRMHPEMNTESSPWQLHPDMSGAAATSAGQPC